MKKVFVFILVLFSLSSFCLAAPEDEISSSSETVEASDPTILYQDFVVDDSVSGSEVISQLISALNEKSSPDPVVSDDLILNSVELRSVAPITPSGSGLKSALLSVIGDYDPVVVEYQYQSQQGYVSYLREIQPDYCWLCSAAILLVVLFCLFKLGGAALSRK